VNLKKKILLLWDIFALLDPDPIECGSNPDPDPQPCLKRSIFFEKGTAVILRLELCRYCDGGPLIRVRRILRVILCRYCDGGTVNSREAAEKFRHCTHIRKNLEIRVSEGEL
jgi:hypothetical protein